MTQRIEETAGQAEVAMIVPAATPPSLWLAVALGIGVAVGHGVARFAYALLLPAMQADLGWSYSQAGSMNTANAAGYVVGAGSCYFLLARQPLNRLFNAGLLVSVGSLMLTGLDASLWWLGLMRVFAGIGAAWIFACGGGLVAAAFHNSPRRSGLATGIYFSGAGVGICISAVLVPPLLGVLGNAAWSQGWLILGLWAAAASIWPFQEAKKIFVPRRGEERANVRLAGLVQSLAAYFLFAAGYIVYMTFICVWLKTRHISWQYGAFLWIMLGLAVFASPFVWSRPLKAWKPQRTLAASCAVTCAGSAIPLLGSHPAGLLVSVFVFGIAMFITSTAVTVQIRSARPAAHWAPLITIFTIVFSVGQALGPLLAGWIADTVSLEWSLAFGGAMLVAAAAVAALQNDSKVEIA